MSRLPRLTMLLLGLDACGAPTDGVQSTDPWADSMVPPVAEAEQQDGEEDEDEQFDPFEEGEGGAYWFGEGEVSPGVDFVGGGEFVAGFDDEELCIILYAFTASAPLDDCPGCDFAFELTLGEVEIEVDEGCAEVGVEPARVAGQRLTIGYIGEDRALARVNGSWIVGGRAEHPPEGFEFMLFEEAPE